MGETRVIYDTFDRGEFGHLGAVHAPAGSFTARNMVVYPSGLAGPRAGLKALGYTGGAPAAMLGAGWHGTPGADHWFIQGTAIKSRNNGTSAIDTWTGALASAPTRPPAYVIMGNSLSVLTNFGDKCYEFDHLAKTVTALAGSPGGRAMAFQGERMFIGGFTGTEQRVFYSAAGDYTSWPVENFFDVGAKAAVVSLLAQRDHLLVGLEDGSWWVYRGVGSTASLRRATSSDWQPWVFHHNAAHVLSNGEVVELSPMTDYPLSFDGATAREHQGAGPVGDTTPYSTNTGVRVFRGRRDDEAVVLRSSLAQIRRLGIWTLHTFTGVTVAPVYCSSDEQGKLLVSDGDGVNFWWFNTTLARPAFVSDDTAQPGDGTTTPHNAYLRMPIWHSQPGTEVLVKQVIVDFAKWDTGSPSDNGFELDVDVHGRFDVANTVSPGAQSWSEPGASATTGGIWDRHTFNVGDQGWGSAFQVGLTGIKGVAIRAITVVVDTQPSTPRF